MSKCGVVCVPTYVSGWFLLSVEVLALIWNNEQPAAHFEGWWSTLTHLVVDMEACISVKCFWLSGGPHAMTSGGSASSCQKESSTRVVVSETASLMWQRNCAPPHLTALSLCPSLLGHPIRWEIGDQHDQGTQSGGRSLSRTSNQVKDDLLCFIRAPNQVRDRWPTFSGHPVRW